MILKEIKGEVKFYENEKGKLFQEVNGELLKVKDGRIAYRDIKKLPLYLIKYNLNGVHGFSIFKGSKLLEDNIWSLEEAISIANDM